MIAPPTRHATPRIPLARAGSPHGTGRRELTSTPTDTASVSGAENLRADQDDAGVGSLAQAHHALSLHLQAESSRQPVDAPAQRVGNTVWGAPDLYAGEQKYTVQFCDAAYASYSVGATMVGNGTDLVAQHAGQVILVPADQLAQVQHLHSQAIADAWFPGGVHRMQALKSLQFADHIRHAEAQSIPLTYADAAARAEGIRDALRPDFLGNGGSLLGESGDAPLRQVSIALATLVGPALMVDVGDALRGTLTAADVSQRLQQALTVASSHITAGWCQHRHASAIAIPALGGIDTAAATLLTDLLVDTLKLSQLVQTGALPPREFGAALWDEAQTREDGGTLTPGAFWIFGALELLVPIIIERTLGSGEAQRLAVNAWRNHRRVFLTGYATQRQRAALLASMAQHFRSASASAQASARAAHWITQDLLHIATLAGRRPAAPLHVTP